MIFGIDGSEIPTGLPYAGEIGHACSAKFPPCAAYAIAWRESIGGEVHSSWPSAAKVVSGDGGHGLFQLTSSWPDNWEDPFENAQAALRGWLIPDMLWWRMRILGITGDDLVRCIGASFNAGRGQAWTGHTDGNVDKYTTDNYGQGVLEIYRNLITKRSPE